jgi:hypothetical protein
VPAPIASADDPAEKIMQLKRLLDAGAITEEDFQQKKTSVLSQLLLAVLDITDST